MYKSDFIMKVEKQLTWNMCLIRLNGHCETKMLLVCVESIDCKRNDFFNPESRILIEKKFGSVITETAYPGHILLKSTNLGGGCVVAAADCPARVVVVLAARAAAAVEAVGVGRRLPVGEVGAVAATPDAPRHAGLLYGLWVEMKSRVKLGN